MAINNQTTGDDGEAIRTLRGLALLRAAGVLSEPAYTNAYRRLNRATGHPCDRCGNPPAQLRRGSAIYCGRCYLETT